MAAEPRPSCTGSSAGWAPRRRTRSARLAAAVRWTRHNRAVVEAARRLLREAYPANPRDALDAISGTATWPGPALLWARIDRGRSELVA